MTRKPAKKVTKSDIRSRLYNSLKLYAENYRNDPSKELRQLMKINKRLVSDLDEKLSEYDEAVSTREELSDDIIDSRDSLSELPDKISDDIEKIRGDIVDNLRIIRDLTVFYEFGLRPRAVYHKNKRGAVEFTVRNREPRTVSREAISDLIRLLKKPVPSDYKQQYDKKMEQAIDF